MIITLFNGDSEIELKKLKTNSIDGIITDPPYGIKINNKDWDKNLPSIKIWKECFRVLKPGGFICAMGSARLYHRLATTLEDVGFITHQMMAWVHGSGMPKGMCLARMMDRNELRSVPDDEFRQYLRSKLKEKKLTATKVEDMLGIRGMFSHYLGKSQPQYPSLEIWQELKKILDLDERFDDRINAKRKSKNEESTLDIYLKGLDREFKGYIPKTENGKKWFGHRYGLQTLRPVMEPIYIGQKPFKGRPVDNILRFGTGAINVDFERYPTNLIHDNSHNVQRSLKESSSYFNAEPDGILYFPKPRRKDFNKHPTVKPLGLMEHLINLFIPKGGIVLDPFMGSGTTGVASIFKQRRFIGIEKETEYFNIAKRRLLLEDVI